MPGGKNTGSGKLSKVTALRGYLPGANTLWAHQPAGHNSFLPNPQLLLLCDFQPGPPLGMSVKQAEVGELIPGLADYQSGNFVERLGTATASLRCMGQENGWCPSHIWQLSPWP